ncbi:MAG: kelch repeat-containing protein [Bacteroidia bacterium]
MWWRKNDLPASVRDGAMSFSIGNKAYIVAGRGNISVQYDTWQWDMANNTWVKKADFPGGKRYFGCGFTIGTKGYVTCGYDGAYSKNDLWEYDPSIDLWTRKSDLPSTQRHHAVCFTIGSKAYVGTGWCDTSYTALQDFWQWDEATDTWSRIADFGGGPRQGASSFSTNSKGYVGCGESHFDPYSGSVIEKDFWEFDPSINTWTRKQDYGGQAGYHGLGFSIGKRGYFGFGLVGERISQDLWEWDSQSDQWTQKSTLPQCERFCGSSFVIGNTGFILLGTDTFGKKDLWQMDLNMYTSVEEAAGSNEALKIWPNPADGSVSIRSLTKLGQIEIINSSGQIIKEIDANGTEHKINFDAPGDYFLRTITKDKVLVQKILVLRN